MSSEERKLIHTLLNKLTVVIGECDLIQQAVHDQRIAPNKASSRITLIRETAREMTDVLRRYSRAKHLEQGTELMSEPELVSDRTN